MSLLYFWKDGRVVEHPRVHTLWAVGRVNCFECFCVDALMKTRDGRYGKFTADRGWVSIKLEHFPPEFRTSLLLLGVT